MSLRKELEELVNKWRREADYIRNIVDSDELVIEMCADELAALLARKSLATDESVLSVHLKSAANYIDVLGGDSKAYRAALGSFVSSVNEATHD